MNINSEQTLLGFLAFVVFVWPFPKRGQELSISGRSRAAREDRSQDAKACQGAGACGAGSSFHALERNDRNDFSGGFLVVMEVPLLIIPSHHPDFVWDFPWTNFINHPKLGVLPHDYGNSHQMISEVKRGYHQ